MECSLCGEDIPTDTLRCEAESRLLDGDDEVAKVEFELCESCIEWIHDDLLELEEPKAVMEIARAAD
jgi:hypothetical protein